MTSSPDVSRGSIAARNERGADRGAESGQWTPRETLLLRGASAADAVPYQRGTGGTQTWGRRNQQSPDALPVQPATAPPAATTIASRAATTVRGATVGMVRDLASSPSDVSPEGRTGLRLGDVYAEQLARLREEARREGWAAGHAEGLVAAEQVVAAAERAAEERL